MRRPYSRAIGGLLRKRREMMAEMQSLRERMAELGNDVEPLDRTLGTLGHAPDLEPAKPRSSSRTMLFHRNERKRFLLDQMRGETAPISSRTLADRIATAEGKDNRDRKLVNDLVKWVGKSLKLLRQQGLTRSAYVPHEGLLWELVR